MITSTPHTDRRSARVGNGGFTLSEVLIAATLSTFVLAGVLSAFLLIGRTGFAASNYSELEAHTRRGLEVFGNDVRKATDVRWNSAQSVTLSVATASTGSSLVTYAYDNDPTSATYQCFYRVVGDGSSGARMVLMRNVAPDFTFERFKLMQDGIADNTAASDLETKQLQVTLRATRRGATVADANQAALSARYILRNKRVAN